MSRIRIKICGLTRPSDARLCDSLGADLLGLVFVPGSRRVLSIEQAARVLASIRWARPVGLFMNQPAEQIRAVVEALPALALLQFHGDESAQFCGQFGLPYIKALAMTDSSPRFDDYPDAQAILLDTHAGAEMGGSGESFDWARVPGDSQQPLILAGGLKPANVAAAIAVTRPFAVDVSSGVEAAPGHKQPEKLTAFFAEVNRVSNQQPR